MISEALLQDISTSLADTVTAITPIPSGVSVADSTEKYILRTTRADFILIISNEVSPLLVKRGTDRQREARAHLFGLAAEPVELPVHEGFTAEKSYAVWLRRQPLSSNRVRSKIERMLIAPRIYRWLREIASQAKPLSETSRFVANLERLQEVAGVPQPIKIAADKASKAFRAGDIPAVQVVQHGDLWTGNILKAPSKTGFIIIDWAGARIDGAPYFDLVNFSLSIGASRSKLRREIAEHSRLLGGDPRHALAYVLSGLGALHIDLEHFPESCFLEMCERNFYTLQAVTST
jgi:hypothetical protein